MSTSHVRIPLATACSLVYTSTDWRSPVAQTRLGFRHLGAVRPLGHQQLGPAVQQRLEGPGLQHPALQLVPLEASEQRSEQQVLNSQSHEIEGREIRGEIRKWLQGKHGNGFSVELKSMDLTLACTPETLLRVLKLVRRSNRKSRE